eukprot:TRINITY_DN1903_c0_g1_i2.p1 TRINITY_DN1903_c0_g1~~TRINITY_DN1903_c0_g1_i2.p1  ORF type:complete len:113 (-),score=22.26 TRINITY_DN1903_c0_g1_i2:278-616(-)
MAEKWKNGLCGCMDDMETCLCACFCPCIQFGKNYEALEGSGFVPMCVAWTCLSMMGKLSCFLGCFRRAELRKRFNIKGNSVEDFCCHCCCDCCAIAQEAREIKGRIAGVTFS